MGLASFRGKKSAKCDDEYKKISVYRVHKIQVPRQK